MARTYELCADDMVGTTMVVVDRTTAFIAEDFKSHSSAALSIVDQIDTCVHRYCTNRTSKKCTNSKHVNISVNSGYQDVPSRHSKEIAVHLTSSLKSPSTPWFQDPPLLLIHQLPPVVRPQQGNLITAFKVIRCRGLSRTAHWNYLCRVATTRLRLPATISTNFRMPESRRRGLPRRYPG